MVVPRGKVTGGSSAINGEIFLRGIAEDFDGWAAQRQRPLELRAGAARSIVAWSATWTSEAPITANDGPIPVKRWPRGAWLPPQTAFYAACLAAGFPEAPDHNAPDATGVGADPAEHPRRRPLEHAARLLESSARAAQPDYRCPTARARAHTPRRGRAVGIVADGARSELTPRGRRDRAQRGRHRLTAPAVAVGHRPGRPSCGQPACRWSTDPPGVGQNLRDHPHVYATWQPRSYCAWTRAAPRYQVALRYTAPGSSLRNDMQILMVSFATSRVDRGGDGLTPVGITLQPVLNLAPASGELRLQSADPRRPAAHRLQFPARRGRPAASARRAPPVRRPGQPPRVRPHSRAAHRPNGRRPALGRGAGRLDGRAKCRPPTTFRARARWARRPIHSPSSVRPGRFTASTDCASWTRRSCPTACEPTPTRRL